MSTRPILFGTEMARAILEDRKTVTRRVCHITVNGDMSANNKHCCAVKFPEEDKDGLCAQFYDKNNFYQGRSKPPYRPGDILYVREAWAKVSSIPLRYAYKADNDYLVPKWRPSIHMPREAARIFLRVTDVRVERLQDITIMGMQMEGANRNNLRPEGCSCAWKTDVCMDGPCSNRDAYEYECWSLPFIELWNSTIKKTDHALYGWGANPWVWVIEFERISREEAGQC